jgi:hypothetical protein
MQASSTAVQRSDRREGDEAKGGGTGMTSTEGDDLPKEELEQEGESLPDRELMSPIDANVVIPVNAAVAANVLSEDSIAATDAEHDVDIEEGA